MTQRQLLDRGLTTVALLGILAAGSLGPSAVADEGPHIIMPTETPIPMGVSGGNRNHWAIVDGDFVCRTGTLGLLVEDAGGLDYILSANHVLARLNRAVMREEIIQPGLVDQETKCSINLNNTVAHLSAFVPFTTQCTPLGGRAYMCPSNNVVDAAIAEVVPDSVSADILDIGPICNDILNLAPAVDMPVVKSGRTTGLTFGKISAVDVDVAVEYRCLECTDPAVYLFVDQFLIKPGSFVAPGDSGSAVISAVDHRVVGLVFAGAKRAAVANRFDRVATALGVTPVGDSPENDPTVCGMTIDGGGSSGGPGGGRGGGRGRPSSTAQIPLDFEHVRNVRARHADLLFGFPGVVGSGVSVNDAGNPVIEVYLAEGGNIEFTGRRIPEQLEGIAVRQVLTGPFVAY